MGNNVCGYTCLYFLSFFTVMKLPRRGGGKLESDGEGLQELVPQEEFGGLMNHTRQMVRHRGIFWEVAF